ncbi:MULTISPECIES: DUF4826 family protein [Alteromonadaceae]|uniref:DUF4826 family protein n=1 Tax=Alteromonadaceae TaxID=72275 RepID=UPI001C096AC9|nr:MULTISPECIES: DUF4826 family protein [Aliiglaciecola]MBU2878275.1 DUF4826 family protein [Aliiglaciecola lipolytica]MDO6711813.1 DUF4826 family protein [Aliiglaciecola sp. 2_MG-2023]MDO6753013.1 DUF4826 family protein [Aliiglaciecola sp. 1_MG-2023]
MTQPQAMSQEQMTQWVRSQFQRANKHLAENGVIFDSVVTEECRYLAPYVAVWKIKALDKKFYWVISGDLPCDFMPYESEKNARDVLRRFSFQWQLKAQDIEESGNIDKTQKQFAEMLVTRAEGLYALYNQEDLWKEIKGGKA